MHSSNKVTKITKKTVSNPFKSSLQSQRGVKSFDHKITKRQLIADKSLNKLLAWA